jgi:uncharacterized protein
MRLLRLIVSTLALTGLLVVGQGVTPLASTAQAASFDCARARAPDERAVCGNRVLEDRDVELSVLYGLILKLVPMGSRDAIRREQTQWLAGRGRCGADVPCLRRAYDRRIAALRATIDERVVSNGPF